MELREKVALVTGASRGIGRAIAIALSRRGAQVFLNYTQNEHAATQALEAVRAAGGVGHLKRFDVADPKAVDAAVKAIAEQAGRLDILVNNAGIAIDGLILRTKDEDWRRTLEVNLSGAFYCCRAAARYLLRAKEGGRIINITSVVGEQGNAGQVSYVAAKAGIIGLTKTLARELAPRGVTVNAVSPGFVETDMTAAHVTGEYREQLLSQVPLGRIGTPEDVAEAVAFLAAPGASYITGQVIRINGGLLM
ncbi:MAG TPA: 3-oxoacyl-[acyl-carrier-protein] reductase [Polyangia bacterium]|nr:3-oxoacyl-[acyl-carrier-protein] reductase [Polyangia bacterium]